MAPTKKTVVATAASSRPVRQIKKSNAAPISAPSITIKKEAGTASETAGQSSSVATNVKSRQKRKAEEPLSSASNKAQKRAPKATASTRTSKKATAAKPKVPKAKVVLNHAPIEPLNIYSFGNNEAGELGLGATSSTEGVFRPRLNPNLSPASAGVVQMATGGMHSAALTHDNKILTWGVNDLGALGRDTAWDGGMVDVDDKDSDNSESGLNQKEAIPTAIDASVLPPGTVFTQVTAGDNATFALTDEGLVYGWGTFKTSDGVTAFSLSVAIQDRPILVPLSQKVTKISAGNNHVLALTSKGTVLAWGMGEQYQLGRRLRDHKTGLRPSTFGLKGHFVNIWAGANHSFALRDDGAVYSWGLNNYGQTGIEEMDGEDFANILHPQQVLGFWRYGNVTHMGGGNQHSIATTEQGECLTWGRVDSGNSGLDIQTIDPINLVNNERGQAKILKNPTKVPGVDAVFVAAGAEHCIAITSDGEAYSWGFNIRGQAGQGKDEEEIEIATIIDNSAVRGKTLVWAAGGGQFSVLAGKDTEMADAI